MATRQEELEIALRDSITPGLKAIATELKALSRAAKEASGESSDSVDKVTKSVDTLAEHSKKAAREVAESFKKIIDFGKEIIGIGGTIETVKKLKEGFEELANTRVQLTMFAQDTRMTTESIEKMRGAMVRMGIDTKTAMGYMSTMSNKLQDLHAQREGSQLFQELEKMGAGGTNLAKKLMNEADVGKQIKLIEDVIKTQTPEVQRHIAGMLGVPPSVITNLEAYEKKVGEIASVPPEIAQKYLDNLATMNEKADAEWTLFGAHAMEAINKWMDALNKAGEENGEDKHNISAFFIAGFDKFAAAVDQDIKDVERFVELCKSAMEFGNWIADKWLPKREEGDKGNLATDFHDWVAKNAPWMSDQYILGKMGIGKGVDAEQMRLQTDNNKLLGDIKRSLEVMMPTEGAGVYGSQGATYGRGIRGGAMQAGGGGFRPRGGGGAHREYGTKTGYSAGETPDLTNLQGSEYLKAQREPMYKELEEHPELKEHLAALASLEDEKYPTQVVESLMNRTAYVNEERKKKGLPPLTLRDMIRPGAANSFYGPERRQQVEGRLAALKNQPERLKKFYDAIEAARSSNTIKGYTDQGSPGDPNYEAGGGITLPNKERFGDFGGGPGGHAGASAFRQRQQQAVEAARSAMDEDAKKKKSAVFEKGTAAVTVDFGNMKQQTEEAKEGGKVFKPLNNEREPQAPKSGGGAASFNDRWHFQ